MKAAGGSADRSDEGGLSAPEPTQKYSRQLGDEGAEAAMRSADSHLSALPSVAS